MYDAQACPKTWPASRSPTPLEYPGKSGPPRRAGSYQRNRLTDIVEPANRTAQPADGALFRTNSSTFGTLLSSQGSSAHFPQPLGLAEGQPEKPTVPVRASQLDASCLFRVGKPCRSVP